MVNLQIMNGHKYVINETISHKNTPFGSSVFKVRTVDILPLNDTDADAAKATEATPEAEGKAEATTSSSATEAGKTTGEAETIDRGSPEVLEPDNRRNEIGFNSRKRSDRVVEVKQV